MHIWQHTVHRVKEQDDHGVQGYITGIKKQKTSVL